MAHVGGGSLSGRILQALRDGQSDRAIAMALEPLFALWSAVVAAAHHPDPSHPDYQLLIEWRHALVQAIDDVIIAAYAGVGIAAGVDGSPAPGAGPLRRYTQWDTGEVLIEDVLDDVVDDPVVAAQSALLVFLRPTRTLPSWPCGTAGTAGRRFRSWPPGSRRCRSWSASTARRQSGRWPRGRTLCGPAGVSPPGSSGKKTLCWPEGALPRQDRNLPTLR
jgi:hypothetical protein